jgi:hypothetical protein
MVVMFAATDAISIVTLCSLELELVLHFILAAELLA